MRNRGLEHKYHDYDDGPFDKQEGFAPYMAPPNDVVSCRMFDGYTFIYIYCDCCLHREFCKLKYNIRNW